MAPPDIAKKTRASSCLISLQNQTRFALVAQDIMMEPELIEAYRIRGSFLNSRYHSWQCFEFFDADGAIRYIRFRLIPGEGTGARSAGR